MLTDLLLIVPVVVLHWLFLRLGVYEGVHEFLSGMCPCGASS